MYKWKIYKERKTTSITFQFFAEMKSLIKEQKYVAKLGVRQNNTKYKMMIYNKYHILENYDMH